MGLNFSLCRLKACSVLSSARTHGIQNSALRELLRTQRRSSVKMVEKTIRPRFIHLEPVWKTSTDASVRDERKLFYG